MVDFKILFFRADESAKSTHVMWDRLLGKIVLPKNFYFIHTSLNSCYVLIVIPISEVQRYGDNLSFTRRMLSGGTY